MGGRARDQVKGDIAKSTFFWNLYGICYDGINIAMPYRKLLFDAYINLDIRPGHKILDAGCGTGNFERFISSRNIPPIEIEAVDFSPIMLSRARKKCKDLKFVNFALVNLDGKLPYPDDTFDRILCINVLYALENPQNTICEFIRVLKPEGKMVLTNPKPDSRFAPLIQDHFKRIGNIWGFSRKAGVLAKTLLMLSTIGLIPILINVFIIDKKGRKQEYHFLPEEEFVTVFKQNGFGGIEIEPAYADQNLFIVVAEIIPQETRMQSINFESMEFPSKRSSRS
ncbi:MAG: methyltransferase domain-containing protein [Actinomycetota bacterium]|nr:methyltransferase domain-containing protein [Actinomycetota bacterium]